MEDWLKEVAKANPGGLVAAVFVVVIALGALVWLKDVIETLTKLKDWAVRIWVRAQQVWCAPAALLKTQAQLTALQTRLTGSEAQLSQTQIDCDHANTELERLRLAAAAAQLKALSTLKGMMNAANQIRYQAAPAGNKSKATFTEVRAVYLIHQDFTAELRREYRL